jgi:hypothetical protein
MTYACKSSKRVPTGEPIFFYNSASDKIARAEARQAIANPYGQGYIIDFDLVRQDGTVKIRCAWIVRIGQDLHD